MTVWHRVNRQRRCPICDHADWCLISSDSTAAICPRVPSDKQIGNAGWLHRLDGTTTTLIASSISTLPLPRRLSVETLTQLARGFQRDLPAQRLDVLSRSLGVTDESLRRLGVGWSWDHTAFAFPMVEPEGSIIGIRLRRPNGRKFAVRGGREGLFIPSGLRGTGPLLLPEGPTNCAAALSLGFDCIGRPNRNGGGRYLRSYCPRRDVVVVADRDDHGAGQRDAMALARSLFARCSSVRVIEPPEPHNDLRDWLRDRATADDVQQLIERVEPWAGRVVAATG